MSRNLDQAKRATRAGIEDRWHRPPRKGETPPWPADSPGPGSWCVDPKHGDSGKPVTTLRRGQGKRWLARWVDHDGNERSKAFDRKTDAQREVGQVTTALTTGTYADPQRSAVTFETVAQQWLASKRAKVKPKTYGGYDSLLDTVILPKWRETRLRDIDHAGMQSWVN